MPRVNYYNGSEWVRSTRARLVGSPPQDMNSYQVDVFKNDDYVYGNTGNITLTLPNPTSSNGSVRKIVNASSHLVFLHSYLADGDMVLYPNESVNLVSVNNLWSLN